MDRNSCIAVILCLVVFLIFEVFVFMPRNKKMAEYRKKEAQKRQSQKKDEPRPGVKPPSGQPQPKVTRKSVAAKTGTLRNDVLGLSWTNYGAALSAISLIEKNEEGKYRFTGTDWKSPLQLTYVESPEKAKDRDPKLQHSLLLRERLGALGMNASVDFLAEVNWEVAAASPDNRSVKFSVIADSGIRIEKSIVVPEKGYLFDVNVTFFNPDNVMRTTVFEIGGAGGITNESPNTSANRFAAVLRKDDDVNVTPLTSVTSGGGGGCLGPCACGGGAASAAFDEDKPVQYAGIDNTYFGLFMMPVDATGKMLADEKYNLMYKRVEVRPIHDPDPRAPKPIIGDKINACVYFTQVGKDRLNTIQLAPGASETFNFRFFAGPKFPHLTEPAGFGHVYDYDRGWFWWLADLFYWILRMFYSIFRNYGVAIIAMTALIRLGLHPISKRQTASMEKYQKQMQEVKPELDALKEKYKSNQKKFLAEQQKLFRERGMSMLPLGGCLPMLLQLPVFIGLWRCLTYSIELRHQPFIPGWISDLSQPDTITHIATYPVNILPIACVAVMILQMKLQPKPQDKQQQASQRMMMFMFPVLFGFMFYTLPSGLTLYFFASTLIGLIEHRMLKKKREAEEAAAAAGPPPDPDAGGPDRKKARKPSKDKNVPAVSLAKKKKNKKPKKWPYR
ncbi:MAG: membrane protein insertase YidC [Planctomycetota bacterium]|nr:MAG: membrane protein insertase YidC [Planctomycetota bacterium]